MKLSRQIVAMTGTVLLTAVVAVSALAAYGVFEILRHQAEMELQTIGETKKAAFNRYHLRLLKDVEVLANSVLIADAALEFDVAWSSLESEARLALKSSYASDGFLLASEGDGYEEAGVDTGYSDVHDRYHPTLQDVQHSHDFNDLLLLNAEGTLVYSTAKRADFGADVTDANWRDTVLAKAFRHARMAPDTTVPTFYDYKRYRGADDAVVGFVTAPILTDGAFRGLLAYQIGTDALNSLMMPPPALAEKGEVLVVGQDFMVRNDTAFTRDAPMNRRLDNAAVRLALSGETGFVQTDTSAGYYLSYATPLYVSDRQFALVVSQPLEAILTPYKNLGLAMAFGLAVILSGMLLVAVVSGRRLARPIELLAMSQKRLAGGDINVSAPGIESPREAAEMNEAMYVFKKQARNIERHRDEHKSNEAGPVAGSTMAQLTDRYEQDLAVAMETVVDTLPLLSKKSMEVGTGVGNLAEITGSVRDSAKQMSGTVGSLATSAETVNSAFGEVAARLDDTSGLSSSAARQASDVTAKLADLTRVCKQLETLSVTFSEIANKANIVSLNTSLEASRAGADGKGFAVIAGEVKSLAGRIQRAAEETRLRTLDLQTEAEAASVAVRMVSDTVNNANETVNAIEGAVALQAVATGDVARAARTSATGVQSLVEELNTVVDGAKATDTATGELKSTAEQLAQTGTALVNEVSKLLADMRDQAGGAKSEP